MNNPPGRKPFRPDSRDYSVGQLEAMIERGEAVPVEWVDTEILDQGDTGHCVAFGIGGALNTDDEHHIDPHLTNKTCHAFYYRIKKLEGEPGQENGAEVRNGLKQAKVEGLISAYAILKTEDEIMNWLVNRGPVVVGTNWTEDMTNPDADGTIHPTGVPEGGHCWFENGERGDYFLCVNSWGENFGLKGKFRMKKEDFAFLLNAAGEAWAIVQDPPTPVPPKPKPKCKLMKALLGRK